MMNRTPDNDDLQFDRLVDGELSAAERRELLASLDAREHGWRKCALAFLEAQAWGREFKRMVAEPAEHVSLPVASSAPRAAGRWLAIAASLLLAFGLGWFVNAPHTSDAQPLIAGSEQPSAPLRDELPAPLLEQLDPADAVTLLVRDVRGESKRLQVPLIEVKDLDENLAGALPAELRNRFRDRGFDVQRRRRFAPMFFEQNEELVPMVIPVDDTYIVPVNRPIY